MKVWLSSFMANSSPVLIKKASLALNLLLRKQRSYYVLNSLQLQVILLPILKLFAHLLLCSIWKNKHCASKKKQNKKKQPVWRVRHRADPFILESRMVCLSLHSLFGCLHLLSLETGNTVNSIPPLSSSLVFVSQCTQLLSPSLSYTHKSKASAGWSESKVLRLKTH